MIINDRYPTTYSDTNYPLFEYERTDAIKSLWDGFKNYWLGYMNYEKIPTVFMASEFSSTEDSATARIVNTPTNSPVGYTTDSYSYGTLISTIFKESDFSIGSNYPTYLNSFHVPSSAVQIDFSTGGTTGCQLWVSVETGADTSLGTHLEKNFVILSDDDRSTTGLIEFLLGNRDISFSYTVNSVVVTHTLKSQDLEDNGVVEFVGIANGLYYKISVFIAGYGFKPYPGKDSSGTNQRTYHINPCLKMYSEIDNYYVIKSNCIYAGTNTRYDIATHTFYSLQSWGAYIPGIGALGGWDFEFSNDDLSDLSTYEILYNGNTVAYRLSTIVEMWRVYKPSDLVHHFALLMRIPTGVSYGYHAGIYCPEVLDDGEFTGNLLTGELTADDVQPWQWGNITLDGFKEDNIPEYVPPEGDDERTSGSWMANSDLVNFGNANGFVTQYVITGNQLQNLGSYLWSGFWDRDFLDSVMVSLVENFSLNPADILKYFVSIRKYPLILNGNEYNLGWTSKIFIGRGKKGISLDNLTNSIGKLPNFAHMLRTEWQRIPAKFHDFRDYEPCCKVIVYVPFCGEVELTPSQAINSELRLEYCIDFSNGAVECAVVIRPVEKPGDLYIAAVLSGSIGANVQLSASNLSQVITTGANLLNSQVQSLVQDIGTAVTMAAGATEVSQGTSTEKGKYLGGLASTIGGNTGTTLSALQGMTGTSVPKFNNNSGFSSFLVLTPNIQISYRWYEQPENYGHAIGYACNKTVKIGNLTGKGFSVFRNVDLSGIPATQDELAAIENLLQSGVYL